MNKNIPLVSGAIALLVPGLLTGCLLSGLMKTATIEARNPLNAQPVSDRRSSHLAGTSEGDCTVWPLEDEIQVSATDSEICIAVTIVKLAPSATWSGPGPADSEKYIQVMSDSQQTNGPSIKVDREHHSKIGQCGGTSVWTFRYNGCGANDGTLTAETAWLSADRSRWNFKSEQPATTASQ